MKRFHTSLASEASLCADGVPLAVTRIGSGRPVLCLHATGHGSRDFAPLAERVKDRGIALTLIDWPGQGASGTDAQPASASRYAELLAAAVPQLFPAGERILILGNSIGGAAAIHFAQAHPARVAGLVLCDPGGLAPLGVAERAAIALMVRFFSAGRRGARWFAAAFAAYYRIVLPREREQRARIIAAARETAPVIEQAWRSFANPREDLREKLAQLDCPILFAWARGDRIVALSGCRAAIASARQGALETFAGGHSPFLEDPERFAESLLRFADSLAG